jgi:hypothetical protein
VEEGLGEVLSPADRHGVLVQLQRLLGGGR